jgi:hypothetical protein
MTKKSFSKCFSSRIIKEIEIRFSEKKKELGRPEINSRPVAVSGLSRARGRTTEPARSGRGPGARFCPREEQSASPAFARSTSRRRLRPTGRLRSRAGGATSAREPR